MLVLSHRGDCRGHPENTLEAFAAAIALGVDGIETDIRLTRDGRLVLFHDRSLRGRAVARLTHAELEAGAGYAVPSLADLLDRWPDVFWNLELKVPEAVEPVLAELEGRARPSGILLTSFWHRAALRAARLGSFPCGVVISHRPLRKNSLIEELCATGELTTVVWNVRVLDVAAASKAAAHGLTNLVYGVSERLDPGSLDPKIIHGVITDYPEKLLVERGTDLAK